MAITKAKKQEIIKELGEKLAKQKALVFADFSGLKVKDLNTLKAKLRENKAEFKVAKKTLLGIAFKEHDIDADPAQMEGEIALILGYGDETGGAKAAYEFERDNKGLKIIGGYLENKMITLDQVVALAKLPSKAQLYANLVGSMSSPARNFAGVLQANLRNLVYVLSQVKKEA